MIYLDLLLGFLKVGCFSFGGAYAAIPVIREIVLAYNWMGEEMLQDMIAVSESTPGPLMVNLATYIGAEKGGLAGSAIATLAVILPAFVIILLIMAVFDRLLKHPVFRAALDALKACVIGIILAMGAYMIVNNLIPAAGQPFDWRAAGITAALAGAAYLPGVFRKKKLSSITLIIVGAVLGMIVYAY